MGEARKFFGDGPLRCVVLKCAACDFFPVGVKQHEQA
jgi:hypothetical protein